MQVPGASPGEWGGTTHHREEGEVKRPKTKMQGAKWRGSEKGIIMERENTGQGHRQEDGLAEGQWWG